MTRTFALNVTPDPGAGSSLTPLACGVGVAILAASYFATGYAGLTLAYIKPNVTLIWAPTGIAVAALFRGGLRLWPGVFLGALLSNLAVLSWPTEAVTATGIAVGNTLGPVLAVVFLKQARFSPRFDHRRDILVFATCPALAMLVSATNGAVWQTAAGIVPPDQFLDTWLVWWLGDAAGVLVVSPVLLAFGRSAIVLRPARLAELSALLATVFALAVLVFDPFGFHLPDLSLDFLPILMLVWVGLRYRIWPASVGVLILSVVAVVGTARGNGPFRAEDESTRLLLLWAFMTTAAVVTQLIAALMAERTWVETVLAATAAEYRAVVNDAPALICRYTPDGTLTFANEPLCRFLGHPVGHVLGASVLEFLPVVPVPERPTEMPSSPSPDQMISRVAPLVRADGVERWHRWTARPIPGPDGRVREYHAVGVDMTDRRQADEERLALERKMLEAQRLESLGVLAGGVAHDFNNLLAGVLGHAELAAAAAPPGSRAREHIDAVLAGIKQAGGLTRQLLAYSGKGMFVVRPVNLTELVRETEGLLRASVPRGTEPRLRLADDLPPVAADPTQIRQVLVNLVTNAGEALADHPGSVSVSTAATDLSRAELPDSYLFDPLSPGRYVLLTVADTGPGMDESTRARLFDPFFTTRFAGRGLGMSAVLGIIRGHRGGIRVESEPGAGTTVTVYLPVSDEAAASPEQEPTPDAEPRPAEVPGFTASSGVVSDFEQRVAAHPEPAGDRPVVLVVDDEDAVRRVAQMMLEQLGYSVLAAADGEQAVDLFSRNAGAVRVVILDLTMPQMGGPEVMAAIRQINPSVPVILCSGYTEDAIPESLARAGLTGFLQKPFSLADLDRLVRAAVAASAPGG
ncbi:MAG TPA: MASE1 domain-containing protein [Gemmataceae bacterium]|nr:MASE1 domain-containing protein [Gemmataceae bacterium]